MAKSYSYNSSRAVFNKIYRATSGGTVFSADLHGSANFDLFDDSPSVDDAIYFTDGAYSFRVSDIEFDIGTAMAGTDIVLKWEYYKRDVGWTEIEDLKDDTNSFQNTGVNVVRFPAQWQPAKTTVNGYNYPWLRCRLDGFTSVSEGGRTQNSTIKHSNGQVKCYGGTEADPITFQDIFDWMQTNYPHVSLSKYDANTYDFRKIGIYFASWGASYNELILLGVDSKENMTVPATYLMYFTSGYKKDEITGYAGSTFIVYGRGNSDVITTYSGSNTKLYGCTFRTAKNNSDGFQYAGYLQLNGDIVDCSLELAVRLPTWSSSNVNNVRIIAGLLIAEHLEGAFKNVSYLTTVTYFMYLYGAGFVLDGFAYQFKNASGYLFYIYRSSYRRRLEWVMRNPSTPLTLLSDSIKPAKVAIKDNYLTIEAVKFYDSSAGTYTDYTAAAQNSTADDVPLSGEVGDYYLFGLNYRGNAYGTSLRFEITPQTNDYGYTWEYYDGSDWQPIAESGKNYIFDQTDNLTKSGSVILVADDAIPAATLDGVSSYWLRARITAKGTAFPVASQIRQSRTTGASDWTIWSEYSFDLTVLGESGPIENATITATDGNGDELFSVPTDSAGAIATQYIKDNVLIFDPVGEPSTWIKQTVYGTFSVVITKPGYQKLKLTDLATGSPIDWTLKLNRAGIAVDQEVF